MTVFVVYDKMNDEVDSVFASRAAARASIRARHIASYKAACAVYEGNMAAAERWIKAGGGISVPVVDPGTFREWFRRDAWIYDITEHDVR